jgi:hypothetical protein
MSPEVSGNQVLIWQCLAAMKTKDSAASSVSTERETDAGSQI